MIYFIWGVTFLFLILSFFKDKAKTINAIKASIKTFRGLLKGIFLMVVILGFILAIIPKGTLIDLFSHKGIIGFTLVSFVGAIVTIPGPIAFPLAGSLYSLGASKAMLASFITTLTMVGFVTAPLEISFFGKRFTIMRQSLSFIAAIIIGLIMGAVL